jgi:plastocyanin
MNKRVERGKRVATLAVCLAAMLTAGCGSSSSSTGTSSSSTGASGSTQTGTSTTSTTAGGLKATTTPKYGVPAASAPVLSGLVQIAYRNITIAPDAIKVKVGSTIRWTNYDPINHTVTSEGGPQEFASKDLGQGGTFEIKALKPGVIHYECTIHPASMNGTIEVVN